jgi:hypothetical protein
MDPKLLGGWQKEKGMTGRFDRSRQFRLMSIKSPVRFPNSKVEQNVRHRSNVCVGRNGFLKSVEIDVDM